MKQNHGVASSFSSCILLVLIILSVFSRQVAADEADARLHQYHSLLSGVSDPLPVVDELVSKILSVPGSSYLLTTSSDPSMPLLVACDTMETEELPVLIVVDLDHVKDAASSLAGWLAMLEWHVLEGNSCSVIFSILPPSSLKKARSLEAGDSFWLPADPYLQLANLNPDTIVLLDVVHGIPELSLQAESRGRLAPLHVLQTLRDSLEGLGLEYREHVVAALYARAGLIEGSAGLLPWLERGIPAIRLYGPLDGQSRFLPAAIRLHQQSRGNDRAAYRDVNYLRYQLPAAVITIDDLTVTRTILILLGIFMASVAMRPLFMHKRTGDTGPGVLPEALVAYLFSFIAVSLSWLIHGFAASLFGSAPLTAGHTPLVLTIGILGRLGSTMFFFFALSGLSARSGLLPHTVRGTASQASALIAGVLGMSILYFSIQGSLLLFATMILLSLAGINAAVAILSITALVVILFPLVVSTIPVFVPGLITILNARGMQLLLLAGFTAPAALWILTTLSPRHRLVWGDRTAPYLIAAAGLLCFLEPWLRARL
jgi:hypothetical protein